MKAEIHPQYFQQAHIQCSCGNVIVTGSTKEKMKTELCSKCHPFYTGQQKLVDTAGRVDKFQAKRKKSAELIKQAKLQSQSKKKKPEAYQEKVVPEEVLKRAMGVSAVQESSKWGTPLGDAPAQEVVKEEIEKAKKPAAKKTATKKAPAKAKKAKAKKAA